MRLSLISLIAVGCVAPALLPGQTVGGGAPSASAQSSFINAYFRGGFAALTSGPSSNVRSFGSTGLIQEFSAAAGGGTLALIKPDANAPTSSNDTLQMYAAMYAFYTSIGVTAAGFPTTDTATCPPNTVGACTYQLFTKNHALFAFTTPFAVNYAVADPFYTKWFANGGPGGTLGLVASGTSTVTSAATTSGTQQLFAGGTIYSYPAGATAPSTYMVSGTIYAAFSNGGAYAIFGFPTTDEVTLASGLHRQQFEKSRIEWTPGNDPVTLFPLKEISIVGSAQGTSLNLGATATLTANIYDARGNVASGRTLTWSTSNGNAVTVQGNGATAVIKAVGPGVANILLTGEGISSSPFPVRVNAPCCAIGEGAPTLSITQAFQNAASRNHLAVALPSPSPVTRIGNGFVQTLTASDASGAVFVISQSDKASAAYVMTGPLYTAYVAAGGFTGTLGYPASDASAGATQSFENGAALSGTGPVRLVPSPIAAKWLALGAETGLAGAVGGDAIGFVSSGGVQGKSQTFAGGTIFGITSGSRAGQGFFSGGLVLARYLALNGPAGTLGTPVQDLAVNAGVQLQNFETGFIDLQPGAAVAVEHFNPRKPGISITPATAVPGGRVHISLTGFAFGASLTVTITGQPNFVVQTPGGEFGWDVLIPANAKPATVAIQARANSNTDTASGSYAIVSLPQLQPRIAVVSGDQQTGLPGSLLPAPLVAVLRDIQGNPLPGVSVAFTVSPGAGAQVTPATDENGRVTALLRLPPSSGVAVLTLSAAGQVTSFSALSTAGTIQGVPAFPQTTPQGSRIAALAALVRYYQNSGALGAPNGFATAAGLAQYLASNNGLVTSDTGAAIANPWAATRFAGLAGGISLEKTSADSMRDLLGAGSPLAVELSLTVDGKPAGSTTVNAVGTNSEGSIAILDPNPGFGRSTLAEYQNGFDLAGHPVQGTVTAVIRIVPALAARAGFVVTAPVSAGLAAASPAGNCAAVDLADPAVAAGQATPARVGGVRFVACDGSAAAYQVSLDQPTGATVYDLSGGAGGSIPASGGAWQVARNGSSLAISAQGLSITSVVNAAGFGPGLAPGAFFTIFGSGLAGGSAAPSITVGGFPAPIVAAGPFQINARMPLNVAPGKVSLLIAGPLGSANADLDVAAVAPGIFVIGTTTDRALGAILNQDGSINGAASPISRGSYVSVYGTGLGPTVAQQGFQVVPPSVAVRAVLNGTALIPSYAGLTPGIAGLYQINFQVPAGTPPGVSNTLAIQAGGQSSNVVALAIQ